MTDLGDRFAGIVPLRGSFDYELQLIREAIAMVAAGKAPRVVLAGIHHAEVLLDPARSLAEDAGVDLTPLPRVDELGLDISVQRPAK